MTHLVCASSTPSSTSSCRAINVAHVLASFVFLADILFKARVLGYETRGAVVTDRKSIRRRYLVDRRWQSFVPDVMAVSPLVIVEVPLLVLLTVEPGDYRRNSYQRVAPILRCILHLAKLHDCLDDHGMCMYEKLCDTFDTLKASFVALLLIYFFVEHCLACMWFIVNEQHANGLKQSWMHSLDDLAADADAWDAGNRTPSMAIRFWIAAFYWGSTAGDGFTAVNTRERLVGIVGIVIMVNLVKAYIISSINDVLTSQRGTVKQTTYRLKVDAVNRYLREYSVPSELCKSIRTFYKEVWLRKNLDFTESTMLHELPDGLRKKAMRVVMMRSFMTSSSPSSRGGKKGVLGAFFDDYFTSSPSSSGENPSDHNNDGDESGLRGQFTNAQLMNWVNLLSTRLNPMSASPGEFIVLRGDSTNTDMFLLKNGVAEVVVGNKGVVTLTDGAYFGDILLLGLMKERTASIRAVTYCELFSLSREDLRDVFRSARGLESVMISVAKKRLRMAEERDKASKQRREAAAEEESDNSHHHGGAGAGGASSSTATTREEAAELADQDKKGGAPAGGTTTPSQTAGGDAGRKDLDGGMGTGVPHALLRELGDAVSHLKKSVVDAEEAEANRVKFGTRVKLRRRSKMRSAWGKSISALKRQLQQKKEDEEEVPLLPSESSSERQQHHSGCSSSSISRSEDTAVLLEEGDDISSEERDAALLLSASAATNTTTTNPLAAMKKKWAVVSAVGSVVDLWVRKASKIQDERAEEMRHVELYDDDDETRDNKFTQDAGNYAADDDTPHDVDAVFQPGVHAMARAWRVRSCPNLTVRWTRAVRRWLGEAMQSTFGSSVLKTRLIHPDSPFSTIWNAVQLACLLIICVYVPLRFAFTPFWRNTGGGFGSESSIFMHEVATITKSDADDDDIGSAANNDAFANPMWLAFEDTIQIILALDVLVKLATGYHVLGAAVMSGRLARRKYVFSWAFPLDILACIPIVWYLVEILVAIGAGSWHATFNRLAIITPPRDDDGSSTSSGRRLSSARELLLAPAYYDDDENGIKLGAAIGVVHHTITQRWDSFRSLLNPYVKLFPLLKLYDLPRRGMEFQDAFADAISSTLWSSLTVLLIYLVCAINALACVWFSSMAYFDVSGLSTSWIGTQCDDIHESVMHWMQVFGGGGGGGGGASGSNDTHRLLLPHVPRAATTTATFTIHDFGTIYCACFYWASSAAGAFDVTTTNERLAAIFVQMAAVELFTDWFFASIIGALQNFDESGRRRTEYRTKIDGVNEWMSENGLPMQLRGAIRRFYRDIWTESEDSSSDGGGDSGGGGGGSGSGEAEAELSAKESCGGGGGGGGGGSSATESALLSELPEHLRGSLVSHVVHRSFRYSPFFRYFLGAAADCEYGEDPAADDLIELVARNMLPCLISPGELIIRQGDFGDVMYLIKFGRAEVEKRVEIVRVIDAKSGEVLSVQEKDPTAETPTEQEDGGGAGSSTTFGGGEREIVTQRSMVTRRFPLVPGSYFGEFSVMASVLSEEHFHYHGVRQAEIAQKSVSIAATRRSASVRALSRCELVALRRDSLAELWRKSPLLRRSMVHAARITHKNDGQWWLRDGEGKLVHATSIAEEPSSDLDTAAAAAAAAEGRAALALEAASKAARILADISTGAAESLDRAASALMSSGGGGGGGGGGGNNNGTGGGGSSTTDL